MEAPPEDTTAETSCVTIKIGANEHSVNLKQIPYFDSFVRFQRQSGQCTTTIPVHEDIPFFDVINHGVQEGYRHFFRRMPPHLSDYHVLCETLEFLAIDVLKDHRLREIFTDLKSGKSDDWGLEERTTVQGWRNTARDAASKLLYLFVLGEFESEVKDSNMAYNATLFVVSHRAIFRYRARKMVREAYEERFEVSEKQRKELNKWPINAPQGEEWEEEEVTTEEESSDLFSDFYD